MAQLIMAVSKAVIRQDSRGRRFFQGQDADTNQYWTIYPKKGEQLANVKAGGKYRFSGFVFHFPDTEVVDEDTGEISVKEGNNKMIATAARKV